jgi:hypothetical protein
LAVAFGLAGAVSVAPGMFSLPMTQAMILFCSSASRPLHLNEKVPDPFVQSLRNTHGNRYGYIDYEHPKGITITTAGENHLNHEIKRRAVD